MPRLLIASTLLFSVGMSGGRAQVGAVCNPKIDRSRSLVVTDAALDKQRFSFVNTIDAILGSLNIPPTGENRENFVKSMLTTFNADRIPNPVSGLRMPVDVRALEADLDPTKLLDPNEPTGLVPIGLFNRFDLAPVDFSNCGEHRIVYAFKAGIPPQPEEQLPPSRFFLIFEARVDSASPQAGFEGCRRVANFWRELSDEDDASKRAERLAEFYYKGLAGTSGPVVKAKNYGAPLGQVRGNIFLSSTQQPPKWELREWIVINSGNPTPATFIATTVKDNPLAEFYQDTNPNSLDTPLETAERTAFQSKFNSTFLTRLLETDTVRQFLTPGQLGYKAELDPKSPQFKPDEYKIDLLNRLGARFDNRFNEFQGVSQGNEDDPLTKANSTGTTFKAALGNALNAYVIDAGQKPTVDHVLNRAGAVTCGGCHQFSGNNPNAKPPLPGRQVGSVKGQPIRWPASGIFVHIDEKSQLSPALREIFLPFRQDRLRDAVCAPQLPAPSTAFEGASVASQRAQELQLSQVVAAVRAANEEARAARTAEAVRVIGEQRQEEAQKEGFFVTNRRPH
jgi:hypothetical protein